MLKSKIIFFISLCVITVNAYADGTWWYMGQNDTKPTFTECDGSYAIPPANPTPPAGYVFAGWAHAIEPCSKNFPYGDPQNSSYDASAMTWTVDWGSYPAISGDALCSSTGYQNIGEFGTPDEGSAGLYCWCRMTLFNDGTAEYVPVVSVWMSLYPDFKDTAECVAECAPRCANMIKKDSEIRANMFCPK